MATKSLPTFKVPRDDIGSLLGTMSQKRDELPKTEVQRVQPVSEETIKPEIGINVKEAKSKNSKTLKQDDGKTVGRPSFKEDGVEYVKTSPRLPKGLKKRVDIALIQERFRDTQDRPVTTLDMIVELALERLLATK
jgi:hypothetical protein